MKKYFVITLFVLCFLLTGLGLQAAPTALKILSASPKGQQSHPGRQAVNIHFNQPVVALGEDSAFSAKQCSLSITPKIEGTCRYSGTQTLVFEPVENWPVATEFTVTLPKGFKSDVSGQKLASDYRFSFRTQVPQVTYVLPHNQEHWIGLTPTIYVTTTLPINLDKAASFIKLSSPQDTSVPVSVRTLTEAEIEKQFSYLSEQEKQTVFAITATRTLKMDQKYTLTLQTGLPAKAGKLGLASDYETSFFTYPPLTVQKVVSTGCLPFTPALHLSSPVRKKALYDAIETIPAQAKEALPEAEKDSLGYEFTNSKTAEAYFNVPLSFIKVAAKQNIQVKIKKGLRDIYGNALQDDYSFTISNTGYCPAVDFSADGVGVLESYLPARLPIELINIPSLFVESARFNRDNFIPFYQKEVSYCAKKPLTGATYSAQYPFAGVEDKTHRTYIDLSRFKPTATDSIIFSQFKTIRGNTNRECWLSATDNITDVGITFKTSPENILLWVTSLKTAEPMPGLQVELRNQENKVVWTGVTDANGLAAAPGWGKLDVPTKEWGQPTLYAFVSSPQGDGVVSNKWNDGMELWRFNLDYEYNPSSQNLQTYVFTDRGIYRPGEQVHIKGIIRQQVKGEWRLPQFVRGTLTVSDARGEEMLKKEVTVSTKWGTFDAQLDLPETATTGYWDISFVPQIKMKDPTGATTSFQVESVKPADFNVSLKADRSSYTGGEEAIFSASAQYYFGAPLAQADARWTLQQESTWFTPKGYDQYTFTPYFLQRDILSDNGKTLLHASGKLDSRGALLFSSKMPQLSMPVRIYAEVNIASPAHQNLFKRTSVLLHPADLYIGAKVIQEYPQQGQSLDVELVAVTPEGKPTEAVAVAEIYREQYYSVRKVGLSGRLEWVSEKKVTPLPSQTVTIGKKGAKLHFVPQEAGSYFIKLSAKDLFGRKVVGGIDTYVSGKSDTYGRRTDDDLLKLTPNKNEYKVGQTARIRVESPYETARALVTVEREGILDSWTTTFTGGTAEIKVPIKDTYLPNAYVSVMLVQGRSAKPADYKEDLGKPQGKIGYVNLKVVPESKRLTTTLKANASHYQPREKVTLNLTTKVNGKGTPAEVVVMAVDEGILALSQYQTPDLFNVFYGSKPISVFTMDNRSYVIGQRSFGEKGENRGGGGAAASKLAGTDLRSRFLFTPYFAASVQTDAKGKAQVSFELPDNLTTFRLMAVSLTEQEFGKAEQKITVSKPVMVTPQVPRFARLEDQFTCGAIVYNYEDNKGQFTVHAQAQGAVTLEGLSQQTVFVPKGQSREVDWKCRATQLGPATLSFSVSGRYSDGVQSELEVSTPEHEQVLAVSGSTENAQTQVLQKPARLNEQASNQIGLSLASTALLQLKGGVSYLLKYPYNCLEQQMSKLMPIVGAERLIEDFKLANVSELRKQAQDILKSIPSYQHPSGGYAYWPNALPDAYVTSYALEVALLAKKAGFDVPTQSIDKAVTWLQGAFNRQTVCAYAYLSQETDVARAYSAYVLASYGKNVDSIFNTLYAKRATLPQEAVAYLLQEAYLSGRSQEVQQTLVQQLSNHLVYEPTQAYVEQPFTSMWTHTNNVSATAHTLRAFLQTKHPLDNDFQLVSWLLTQLNAQGYWNDTHTNAMVLRALQEYYTKREEQDPHFEATVKQGEAVLMNASFQGRSLTEKTAHIAFNRVYAQGPRAQLVFDKEGSGRLYYTLTQHYTPSSYEEPVDAGFSVTRTLSTLDGKPVDQFLTGERYKVTLQIKNAAARSFVVVEDFIPAGFSLVNTTLATESSSQAQLLAQDNMAFERTEQYMDRIYGFASTLPAGTHTFSYLVTAGPSGSYVYPAAWVRQMYAPAVFGRNITKQMVIK